MNRQSAGEFLPPLKINIMCLEVSWIFNVSFFPGYLALLLMKWNRLECFNKSVFLCIYLFVIPQRHCRFLIQSPCLMRQIWSHTRLQVSKCLRMNLLSWFSTLTFAFLFAAEGFFKKCSFAWKKRHKNTTTNIFQVQARVRRFIFLLFCGLTEAVFLLL